MSWIDDVLKHDPQNNWARVILDWSKSAAYNICDNIVAGGGTKDEAVIFASCTLGRVDEDMIDLWDYYIDMWWESVD